MANMVKRIDEFNIMDFNERVSENAIGLIYLYKLSHNLEIPDAIIAATSIIYNYPLFTYNTKNFNFIPGLELY